MLPWPGRRGRLVGALAAVALAGCGTVPGAAASGQPPPAVSKPAVSRSDRTATQSRASGLPTACPAWLVKDVKAAAAAKLPAPTVQLQGFGAGHVGETTVKAWLGGSSQESAGELLGNWTQSGLSARHGSEVLTLFTYKGRHIFPFGRGTPGTALTLSVPSLTTSERVELAQAGLPDVPTSGPVQLVITVDTVVPRGTLAAELGAFLAAVHGDLGGLADNYPVTAPAPTAYATYVGPMSPRDVGNLLQLGCAGEPVATIAPDLVSGVVAFQPYWSRTEANAISIGFAPGRVVVESGNAAVTEVQWYAEPAIAVPPLS